MCLYLMQSQPNYLFTADGALRKPHEQVQKFCFATFQPKSLVLDRLKLPQSIANIDELLLKVCYFAFRACTS